MRVDIHEMKQFSILCYLNQPCLTETYLGKKIRSNNKVWDNIIYSVVSIELKECSPRNEEYYNLHHSKPTLSHI